MLLLPKGVGGLEEKVQTLPWALAANAMVAAVAAAGLGWLIARLTAAGEGPSWLLLFCLGRVGGASDGSKGRGYGTRGVQIGRASCRERV